MARSRGVSPLVSLELVSASFSPTSWLATIPIASATREQRLFQSLRAPRQPRGCSEMGRRLLLPHTRRLMFFLRPMRYSASATAIAGSSRDPLHVCVVGSGPAGFYTAEKMLKGHEGVQVDIIDRLPTPFGLVRSGVAPDHPETKIVVNQFSRVAANPRCSFFGNVTLGSDVSLSELQKTYDVVVLAYGAESDRSFGIPGEDLRGIHSAREFVWWYNGHPDMCNLAPDLTNTDSAVVLGQEVRSLVCLLPFFWGEYCALFSFSQDFWKEMSFYGNMNMSVPSYAQCLKNVNVCIKEADLATSPADKLLVATVTNQPLLIFKSQRCKTCYSYMSVTMEEMRNSRIKRRVYELLSKAATVHQENNDNDQKELHFVFFRKPTKFLPSDDGSTVGAVELEKTLLKDDGATGKQVAVGTGEFEELKCGPILSIYLLLRIVLKSIGYKSLPIEGLSFDKYRGVVPNLRGRVLCSESETATVEPGLYVVGWLKRGPTGIVATNLHCAEETVASILEDDRKGVFTDPSGPKRQGRRGLLEILEQKNARYVPFDGWEKIDSKEKATGELKNKPREKITRWNELLEAAREGD
ncbi:NADPH:adrenodoxin oxidoreductase, mitochondrial [Triticum urartu]|uniref:NADPH:adrenodoxin oxidoreductase, mitochondrial n=1 Tax=Triticum urartu TaxID=4572 RepID=M7Z2Z4_TRIUA|nr:NADPH:adrenodoxin oxidoreductase, mitochondrial [Triticum urartu]